MAGPFNTRPFGSPFGATPAAPSSGLKNPFGAPVGRPEDEPAFGAPRNAASSNPLGAPSPSPSPFFPTQPSSSNTSSPAQNPLGAPQAQPTFGSTFPPEQPASAPSASPFGSPSPFGTPTANAMPGFGQNAAPKNGFGDQGQRADPSAPLREPTEQTKQLSPFAYDFANKLNEHLRKENIRPPQWPTDLGNPNKRAAVEGLKDAYKKYRARAYESLRKADLIDDPEKKRRLADALPFKGICEDMCPEFEQISRIAEHDVKREEKEMQPDGYTEWACPSKMLKKFGRSAAGQDAPLPMDVRSVDALRRCNNLPSQHNYLWDRTRAIRRDFTFHSQKSTEEMKVLVYCFETITRFHATALHLLSRKGHAQDDFDDKQEIEQLGRTILSLIEAYDPEFRAYYLLLNANDPSIVKRIPTWGKEYWFESEEVQTAYHLVQVMEDVRQPRGPIKPRRGMTLADTGFTNYFAVVEDPKVHFTAVRQNILKNLVKGYARYRDGPRTISAVDLNKMLRFDTPEEAVEFAEAHNFVFSTEYPAGKTAPPAPYLLLDNKKRHVPSPRIAHTFSGQLVERKRGTASLSHVIYNTVYEEVSEKPKETELSPDSLFVSQQTLPSEMSSAQTPSVPEATPTVQPFPAATNAFGQPAANMPSQPTTTSSSVFETPSSQWPKQSTAPVFGTSAPEKPAETPKPPATTQIATPNQGAIPGASTPFSFLSQPAQNPSATKPPSSSAFGQLPTLAGASTPLPGLEKAADKPAPAANDSQSSPFMTPSPSPEQATIKPKSVTFAPSSVLGQTPSGSSPLSTPPSSTPKPSQQPIQQAALEPTAAQAAASNVPSIGNVPPPTKFSPPKPDLMDGLTKWYVLGDEGLMEQFTDFTVQSIVAQTFQQWQQELEENQRKEEDDLSWREAHKFRTYSLGVKYFYKWQENARARATRRILSQGKEKLRAYREQERIKKQQAKEEAEKAERQARRDARRRIAADGQQLTSLAISERSRRSQTEDQLFASGIFSGLRDERGAVRRVVGDRGWGENPAAPSYAESELDLQPRRLSTSTRDRAGSPDSTDSKKDGWKTRSLREKFGVEHRRSMSASGSVFSSSKLRQSLPATKITNFSRKRSATASEEEREAKRKSASKTNGFRTKHWDLRSRGLVPMPDGQWLPESIARSSRAGDSVMSFDEIRPGSRKSGPPSEFAVDSVEDNIPDDTLPSSAQLRLERLKRDGFGKRKRDPTDDEKDAREGSSPSAFKKVYVSKEDSHAMIKDVQKMVLELKEAMDVLEEDRLIFREQSGVLGDGS
ncbi:SAC3/GANP/Nin1/mts3/eIF-3 p25 family-domain-containing protein [Cercophora newfieldiana]|uniref:SAC3/GANP/Nin1/mts3/eIF-3 p25 family-domain-containing protein n=1 Tax=Cercophora newfieldiana TaxID=92897 RepID=A0AA39YFB8_9PEZI|nr:SAC3/GANP/Nin1/mts3/eIF-3 p25 family-domain-containing protein [Cercophora newfieldiana]